MACFQMPAGSFREEQNRQKNRHMLFFSSETYINLPSWKKKTYSTRKRNNTYCIRHIIFPPFFPGIFKSEHVFTSLLAPIIFWGRLMPMTGGSLDGIGASPWSRWSPKFSSPRTTMHLTWNGTFFSWGWVGGWGRGSLVMVKFYWYHGIFTWKSPI